MKRYSGVRGAQNVKAISAAIEESGGKILRAPDPSVAPFEYEVETADGERLALVCYAFTANKYAQRGRPSDEHRMQVKYGSDFTRYHQLYMDPTFRRITLMFAWHEEERVFVAVDPSMHNPTWFSMSIEFKQDHVDQAKLTGWYGWERERKEGRRKASKPLDNLTTEALLGFTPQHFLTYVALERIASGADAGERLLMIDRVGRGSHSGIRTRKHPLELALGLNASEILDVLGESFRLLVAVRGSVAERHLLDQLNAMRELRDVERLDADGQPDFLVSYRKKQFRIECKNVLRRLPKSGVPRVDFQKTRAAKGNPCSRYYSPDQFEVLAACLHPVTERWEYQFASTHRLAEHSRCPGKITDKVLVRPEEFRADLGSVLDEVYELVR